MKQSMSIPHIEPLFGKEEAEGVSEYILSGGWLTEFKHTKELERQIAEFLGVQHCFMVCNGTMALYVACAVLNVKSITVPDFTMIASPNAAKMAGAEVRFCDVDRQSLCVTADTLWHCENAIMPVDINGRAPDYDNVIPAVRQAGGYIIEDAAQAFGSFYRGKPLGTFGDIGCFSFSPHKIISTGQGGCVVTNDDKIATEIKRFKNFGRASSGGYDHDVFGVNLKFTDLQALVGLEQMKKLPARIEKKKTIFDRYRANLRYHVEFLPTDLEQTTPWYIDILTPHRDHLETALRAEGVNTQKFYPALHNTFWGGTRFPVSEEVSKMGLWLPSSPTLERWQVDYVSERIMSILERMII